MLQYISFENLQNKHYASVNYVGTKRGRLKSYVPTPNPRGITMLQITAVFYAGSVDGFSIFTRLSFVNLGY